MTTAEFIVVQALTGLANASSLFLVACGLSVVFGVTRIVNFAHGSLYMLGAYVAYTLLDTLGSGPLSFTIAVIGAGVAVAVLGLVVEVLLLRRLYGMPELMHLAATFGLLLIIQDATLHVWGPEDLLAPRPRGLEGAVTIVGQRLPTYDLVLIGIGPAVLGLLWLALHRTGWGVVVRAATEDREMAAALGINQKWLFTSVFCLGAFLAAVGGALQLPREPANLMMDLNMIAEAFVVVVVGGMGSVGGAFLAALLISEVHAFGIVAFPNLTLVLVFLVMAAVLSVRPWGLLGRPLIETAEPPGAGAVPAAAARGRRPALVAALLVVVALPLVAGEYGQQVAAEAVIFAVFAVSLQWLVGTGGLISFGHAAYLGLGAYAAALLVRHAGIRPELALAAAPLAGALGALVCGWFCTRLSGVYLAMLTLAFAQILWSVAFQWYEVTGGDNGILGVWPPAWAGQPIVYLGLTAGLAALAVAVVLRIGAAPFGYALRASRDSAARSTACGIDVGHVRWFAFVASGAVAGLAGGLYAFLKGSVFPDVLAIPMSVDGLVMLLLGGVGSVGGAVVGAVALTVLKIILASATELWRAALGFAIIAAVVWFPRGIAGSLAGKRGGGG